jgi:hypothetical protein
MNPRVLPQPDNTEFVVSAGLYQYQQNYNSTGIGQVGTQTETAGSGAYDPMFPLWTLTAALLWGLVSR